MGPAGASAPACAGDNYVTANAGDTLTQIAVGMGGANGAAQRMHMGLLGFGSSLLSIGEGWAGGKDGKPL